MANLDNFSNDEQLILICLVQESILSNALAEITNSDLQTIKYDVAVSCGRSVAAIDESDARKIIQFARTQNKEGRDLVANDIANGKI
ncbi:MAG: hypothetical protein AAFQ14_09775 [Cyanobacteria bacterium J06621_12]